MTFLAKNLNMMIDLEESLLLGLVKHFFLLVIVSIALC